MIMNGPFGKINGNQTNIKMTGLYGTAIQRGRALKIEMTLNAVF